MKTAACKQHAKCGDNDTEEDDHDRERARTVASMRMAARDDRNGTDTPRTVQGAFFLF